MAGSVETRERIESVLARRAIGMVCQPIVELGTGTMVGAEALARFPDSPQRPPDWWFGEANGAQLGTQLEVAAAERAVALLDQLPPDTYLTVNVGPGTIGAPEVLRLVESIDASRLVLELTEHLPVEDYERLRGALDHLRCRGARLAIDDTGAGFASLAHILKLSPEFIKLDRALVRGIEEDPVRRAMAAALVDFAAQTGAAVVAEGIETPEELDVIRGLGITLAQGYLLSRPVPVEELRTAVAAQPRRPALIP